MLLTQFISISVGLILLSAAVSKGVRFPAFANSLNAYRLFPPFLVSPIAGALIVAESVTSAGLLLGLYLAWALTGAAILFALFASVTAVTLGRHGFSDCGCLGGLVRLRIGWVSVGLNALISVTAVLVASLGDPTNRTQSAEGLFVVWGSGVLVCMCYWLTAYAQSVTHLVNEALAEGGAE